MDHFKSHGIITSGVVGSIGYIFKSRGNIIHGVYTLLLSTSRLYYVIVVGILRRFQQAVYFRRSRLRYLLMLHGHEHGGYVDWVIYI